MSNIFKVNYNGEEYAQILQILRTKSGDADGDKVIYNQPLNNDQVEQLELISDIREMTLLGTLVFRDVGRKFLPRVIADGYSFLEVKIEKLNGYNTTTSFQHTFIITDNKISDKEEDLFTLELVSIDWYKFNNRFVYSTMNANKLSATEIMYQMLNKNKLNIKKPSVNSKSRFHYLTPANFSLTDSMNDVMSLARDDDNSMFFVTYDHSNAEYQIKSMKEIIRKPEDIYIDNQLIFPDKDSGTMFSQRNLNFITSKSYISFNDIIDGTKEQIVRYHDYDTRTWKEEYFSRDKINKFFPPPNIKGFKTRFRDIPQFIKSDARNAVIEKLATDFVDEDQFRELFYLTENIEGNTHGVLRRKAGELMFIRVNAESKYYYKFIGAWFITRVYHTFTRNVYENVIQACRTDVASELDREVNNA